MSIAIRNTMIFSFTILVSLLWSQNNDLSLTYQWYPAKIGGGGWLTGMVIHPLDKNLMYVRTDVSGAYRWDATTQSWRQLITSRSLPASYIKYADYGGVESLVCDPRDKNRIWLAWKKQIFRSDNQGEKWVATNFHLHNIYMDPNGDSRMFGERLAVDPYNSNIIYFGSIRDGLWRTFNGGNDWEQVSLHSIPKGKDKYGITTVVFNPHRGLFDGRNRHILVTVAETGIYQSEDGGLSWTIISGANNQPPNTVIVRDAEIGGDGSYYIVFPGGVWRYTSNNQWINLTPEGNRSYSDIAIHPKNDQIIAVIEDGGRLYLSQNQGQTWKSMDWRLTSLQIGWYGEQTDHWLSIGELIFSPDGNELWLAEGFGVVVTQDLTGTLITWENRSIGIEEPCTNAILAPPGGSLISGFWDIGAFYHQDLNSYNAKRSFSTFMSCWDLDWCGSNPKMIVGIFQDHRYLSGDMSGYSLDGGKTWIKFDYEGGIPSDLNYGFGVIAISATDSSNIVWVPANNKMPYYTLDRGKTWRKSTLPDTAETGLFAYYLARKPLSSDKVLGGTFYFYHWGKGLYRSQDRGQTWELISTTLPLGRWNVTLKSVPGKAGHLWLAEGKEDAPTGPLWRSTDGGKTWQKLTNVTSSYNIAFGKEKDGKDYPTIYLVGIINGEHGIYRSIDEGITWEKITTYPLGIFDMIDVMDADKDIFGRVYIGFGGGGVVYGEEIASSSTIKITTEKLQEGRVGDPYQDQLQSSGGISPLFWSVSKGFLPEGLSLDSQTGTISGIPLIPGLYSIEFQVEDKNRNYSQKGLSLRIHESDASPGRYVFAESNGILVFETENFAENSLRTDPLQSQWSIQSSISGFNGSGYVTTPRSDNQLASWENGCELIYWIYIHNGGKYYLWVRRWSDNYGTNSSFIGVNGTMIGYDNDGKIPSSWIWIKIGQIDLGPGFHQLQLRRREGGYNLDRILLTLDTSYVPSGLGP